MHRPQHSTAPTRSAGRGLALAASVLVLHLPVSAQSSTPPPGRLMASNCFQCHGTHGRGPGFEKLAGKSANELYEELAEFRAGKEGQGLMARHAMGYTDAQLRLIAAWLATQR